MNSNETTTTPTDASPIPIQPMHSALKAILILTLSIVTFLACMLPFALRRAATNNGGLAAKVFSLLSVFGGGVFLSTCLLDLLPDAMEGIRNAERIAKYEIGFPVTELLVATGFLFVLIVEQVTLFVRERNATYSSDMEHLIHHHEGELSDAIHSSRGSHEEDVHFNPSAHSTVRAALLVMALSLHAIFEGLSLGLIIDVNSLIQIFGALLLHKSIIGFSLGVRLVQSSMRVVTVIVCCGIFSAQVLIGGFGGLAILDLISAGSAYKAALVSGGAQAAACGTFLYITCFEILPHELNQRDLRLVKLICLVLGFTLIAAMIAVFPDGSSGNDLYLLI
uniref:Zinc transporter ZIP1 n=1 Tax=Ascaris suum TaxID=6253 RepID=F1L8U2_ASCSU